MSHAIRGHDGEAYDVLPRGKQYDLEPVGEGQDDLSYAGVRFYFHIFFLMNKRRLRCARRHRVTSAAAV
jgi:hypothetical protein